MTTMFHITARKNLESIKKLGIIPAYTKGLTCYRTKHTAVWLTDNPEHILTTQAGEEWVKKNDPVVLKVECKGLDIKPYTSYTTGKVVKHEFYFEGTIKQHFGIER
jgi:hypothetical protein